MLLSFNALVSAEASQFNFGFKVVIFTQQNATFK
jgi:hypothetical protein